MIATMAMIMMMIVKQGQGIISAHEGKGWVDYWVDLVPVLPEYVFSLVFTINEIFHQGISISRTPFHLISSSS